MKGDKTSTTFSPEYFDVADVFSPELIAKLLKYIKINDHDINLVNGKQLFYGPIYSLKPIEVETLKTYIKINLANGIIKLSKSTANTLIFFV